MTTPEAVNETPTTQHSEVEAIKDWIETCLDADAHGRWHRAPNFAIILDVAELLAPRIVAKFTAQHEAQLQKALTQYHQDLIDEVVEKIRERQRGWLGQEEDGSARSPMYDELEEVLTIINSLSK